MQNATQDTVTLTPVSPAQLPHVLALLAEAGLPEAGLAEHVATAVAAWQGEKLVGSSAVELYGEAALLRSVAVDPAWRSHGLGRRLTAHALAVAQEQGVRRVYLLTETAADYFARLGFQPVARPDVDPAVQTSVEFTSACPQSAQAMRLDLASVQAL